MTPPSRPGQPRPGKQQGSRPPRRPGASAGAGVPRPETPRPGAPHPDKPRPDKPRPDKPRPEKPRSETQHPETAVTTYAARRRGLNLPVRPAVVSTGSAERFAERASARRRVVRRQAYGAAGGIAAVLVLGWLLLFSPVLALDPSLVEVRDPGTVVTVADVMAVVAAHDGTPLPRLDTVALRDAILEVPGVRSVKVTRAWPHGLVITLVSREPVAAIPDPTGGFLLRDADGVQVGRADTAPADLPVVTIPAGAADTKRTLAAVLGVLEALPEQLRTDVAAVSAESQDTVAMDLRDGAHVEWGSADQAALKIAVLEALRAAPSSAGATVFDVSAPTLPITR